MQQYFPSSSSISNGQYPISCPSSPTPRDANLPQVTDEQARPEEGLQVVMPPATEKGMPWAEPGAGGSRRPQGALPFGLGGWAFGFLIAAIAAICVGAAVGGGLGAALAECRRSELSSGGGGSTVTVTQIATAAAETPGTTDGAYSPMSPGKVATLALECDDEEEDYRAYRSRYWEVNFEQYCGVSYSTGDEAGEGGPNVDISTVVAYSVDDCMDACAATNAKLDRFKMEGERCRAVTFRVELGEYVEASGGNCWLKNGTKPGEQKSSSEGGTPTRAYARIVD